jgi:hypothetical protein
MRGPSTTAKQLVRSYILKVKSTMATETAPEELVLAIVEASREEDERS